MKVDLTLIERTDYLIRARNTGTPVEFADRLGLSLATWHNLKREMQRWGAPIRYSRIYRTYYYRESGKFPVGFMRFSVN